MNRTTSDKLERNNSSEKAAVIELSGYVELGLGREACRVARQILAQKRISPAAFNEVITAIGVVSDPKKWMAEMELAWQRQSEAFRRETNSGMLALYGSSNEWGKASFHAKPAWLCCPSDFLWGIEALLQTGQTKPAARAARKARQALEAVEDEFAFSCLIEALATYHAYVGEWSEAFELWSAAPRNQPFGRNAAVGRVELCLVKALGIIREELETLAVMPVETDQELMLPGNALGMRQDTEKELEKFQRALEKLVSAERRSDLGVNRG